MIKIGIIGRGADKFTKQAEEKAKLFISEILTKHCGNVVLISGHSPMGGIDIWAEEIANKLQIPTDIKNPKQHTWDAEYGYKQRNLDIAKDSDIVIIILVDKLPFNYKGMKFNKCYHCNSINHVKSGACWTGIQALKMGKKVDWYIIKNE
jgi:hypothetical protein